MPILGTVASQFAGKPFSSFESIATASVGGGGAGYVEFTSIPQTFTHLQIRGIARTNRNDPRDAMYFRFNGDTGSNYAWHWIHGNATSVPVGNDINAAPTTCWSVVTPGSQASASTFGMVAADIFDYKNTNKFKVGRILTGFDDNASGDANGRVWSISTLWRDTSAISSVYIASPYGGTLQQYSHFALYGIRG